MAPSRSGTRILILSGILLGLGGVFYWMGDGEATLRAETGSPADSGTASASSPGPQDTTEPELFRDQAPEFQVIPGGSGPLLRVQVRDPLGILEFEHRLIVLADSVYYKADYLQQDELLITRLKEGFGNPHAVRFSLRQSIDQALTRETPVTRREDGSFEAALDLSEFGAIVDVRLIGATAQLENIILRTRYQKQNGETRHFEVACDSEYRFLAVLPAPSALLVDCFSPDQKQRFGTSILVLEAGRSLHQIPVPTGSLQVRCSERTREVMVSPDAVLELKLEEGIVDFRERRVADFRWGEAWFGLLAPGRYLVSLKTNWGAKVAPVTEQQVEIGTEEAVLVLGEVRGEAALTVHFEPGEATELTLCRAGSAAAAQRTLRASAEMGSIRFDGLDPTEWSLIARRGGLIAFARVDTRRDSAPELRLADWAPPTEIVLQLHWSMLRSNLVVEVEDAIGRCSTRRFASNGDGDWKLEAVPGLLSLRAQNHLGLVAETLLLVPPNADAPVPFNLVLELRAP